MPAKKGPSTSDIEKAAEDTSSGSLDTSRTIDVPKLNLGSTDESARSEQSDADKARRLERENRDLKRKVSNFLTYSFL